MICGITHEISDGNEARPACKRRFETAVGGFDADEAILKAERAGFSAACQDRTQAPFNSKGGTRQRTPDSPLRDIQL